MVTTLTALPPVRPASTELSGVITALVTPFRTDGSLDEAAFTALVRRQADAGVSGVAPVGTTGESPTLTDRERDRLIELCVETLASATTRPTVVAGTGTNDTRATIEATRRAAAIGADVALVVAPYYNRPNQAMLEAHFLAVAEDGGLPVIVYNVPSRTASNVAAETLLRLAEHERIVAVKEASGDLDQIARIVRDRPPGFAVLAGDDAWTLPLMALGGDGVVSVVANELPAAMVELCRAAATGDWAASRAVHERLLPLMRANFAGGPNPVPVKAAMAMMGLIEDAVRMPLLPLDEEARPALAAALREAGADLPARVLQTVGR
ncbi:MAG TPA: 4-hydroxy-tetrahydrodipicolinate synthase [Candidatus Limnocylindria bacterium]|nr:4-hydroxy-tetrahydrodipicolinate synthase [Candidatus Limnocylindria bacterium]